MPKFKLSYECLIKAYHDCRKNKRKSKSAMEFEMNMSYNLYTLYSDLVNDRYEIGKSNVFIVTVPVKREVFAADFRDRIVHHLVINRILPTLEKKCFIDDSYACRVGKGTLYGIKRLKEKMEKASKELKGEIYIAKFDLQGFFMSINKNILFTRLDKFIKENVIWENNSEYEFYRDIIKKIIYNCPQKNCIKKSSDSSWDDLPKDKSLFNCDDFHGLPIGNLSSQIFANFYLSSFDNLMTKRFNGYYGRYVDDFYIIHNNKEELLKIIPKLREYLFDKYEVRLHKKKIYIQYLKKGTKFTGSIVFPNRTYVSNHTTSNLYKRIDRAKHDVTKGNFNINYYLNSINSYLGFMKPHNSFNIRKKILTKNNNFEFLSKYYKINENFSKIVKKL